VTKSPVRHKLYRVLLTKLDTSSSSWEKHVPGTYIQDHARCDKIRSKKKRSPVHCQKAKSAREARRGHRRQGRSLTQVRPTHFTSPHPPHTTNDPSPPTNRTHCHDPRSSTPLTPTTMASSTAIPRLSTTIGEAVGAAKSEKVVVIKEKPKP